MTTKEYLAQAYRIDQRINSKFEQIVSLRELATKATSTLSDTPPSGSSNVHFYGRNNSKDDGVRK